MGEMAAHPERSCVRSTSMAFSSLLSREFEPSASYCSQIAAILSADSLNKPVFERL